jgi:activator of HSP90 ATPase
MGLQFTASALIPAEPCVVYAAWLSSETHGAMTGAAATCSAEAGGRFHAWDGYIHGHNLELQENKRITQSWRTQDFSPDEPDSRVVITLEADGAGTRVTIVHSDLPDHGMRYLQGWADFYFSPMTEHFTQS